MKTLIVLRSVHTGEFFRLVWQGELRWTEHALLAAHYSNRVAASLAVLQMCLDGAVEVVEVDAEGRIAA